MFTPVNTSEVDITNDLYTDGFCQKAERYAEACRRLPAARLLELAPLTYLLPQRRTCLLDLFAGSGFVSDFLASWFSKVWQVDKTERLLSASNTVGIPIFGDAIQPEVIGLIDEGVDLAVCLAGFHHVLAKGRGCPDLETTDRLRTSALSLWRRQLNKDGRLIVVDVPAMGISDKCVFTSSCNGGEYENFPPDILSQTMRCDDYPSLPGSVNSNSKTETIWTYTQRISSFLDANGERVSEPAKFFDRFVSQESCAGHEGLFQSLSGLKRNFIRAGFRNVNGLVLHTPWLFASRWYALWFLRELFAIGERSISSPYQLCDSEFAKLNQAVEDNLGWFDLPDGRCGINWKLMYVWGDA